MAETWSANWQEQLAGSGGGLMVCGTTSDAGKTTIVAGLCRLLARNGVSVAPFKAQNMELNSAVTKTGHEIGRAQYLQAQAAMLEPEVAMNPILLKPTSERASQVIVMGKPVEVMTAAEYHEAKPELFNLVLRALNNLRSRFDVVLLEGAGSPTEINLLPNDIVNLSLAERAGLNAIVVGDIDRGGVFASLYGTVALLPPNLAELIGGFVINQFRGDPALLLDGTDQLERACGVPTFGVVPMLEGLRLDAEDSLALDRPGFAGTGGGHEATLDVAVIRFPHISNFTDMDPLYLEEDVAVRFVRSAQELGRPDLVILPGSKATVDDLSWLRTRGLDRAITSLAQSGKTTILGICGGYQMLGREIVDDIEARAGAVDGLGLLPVSTRFDQVKTLARSRGMAFGQTVDGYQIHHGRVSLDERSPGGSVRAVDGKDLDSAVWLRLNDRPEGARSGQAFGTTLHGLFDRDDFRLAFLANVAEQADKTFDHSNVSANSTRDAELDRLADHLEGTLDMHKIVGMMAPRLNH